MLKENFRINSTISLSHIIPYPVTTAESGFKNERSLQIHNAKIYSPEAKRNKLGKQSP